MIVYQPYTAISCCPPQFNSIHCMRSMMWETALLGSVAFSSPWSPWWEVFCTITVILLSSQEGRLSFSSVKPPPCQWCAKTPSQLNGCVCVRVHHWWSFHGSRKQTSPFVRKKYCWTKRLHHNVTTDVKKQPPRRAAMPRIFFTYCDCYCYYYYFCKY